MFSSSCKLGRCSHAEASSDLVDDAADTTLGDEVGLAAGKVVNSPGAPADHGHQLRTLDPRLKTSG